MLLAATQWKATRDKSKTKPKLHFDWFEFERSLDGNLFYNTHCMDKPLFYVLLNLILPVLKAKCKCYRNIRLSCDCMLSIILSFLGGTRISDLQILYRPVKKKLIFSYMHNVIDAINKTLVF